MEHPQKLWTKEFLMISLSNFLLFISFYILMVTLALFSIEHFHASESETGLASSVFVLGGVLVRPIAGKIIGQVGKKQLLLFGLALFLVMNLHMNLSYWNRLHLGIHILQRNQALSMP